MRNLIQINKVNCRNLFIISQHIRRSVGDSWVIQVHSFQIWSWSVCLSLSIFLKIVHDFQKFYVDVRRNSNGTASSKEWLKFSCFTENQDFLSKARARIHNVCADFHSRWIEASYILFETRNRARNSNFRMKWTHKSQEWIKILVKRSIKSINKLSKVVNTTKDLGISICNSSIFQPHF